MFLQEVRSNSVLFRKQNSALREDFFLRQSAEYLLKR